MKVQAQLRLQDALASQIERGLTREISRAMRQMADAYEAGDSLAMEAATRRHAGNLYAFIVGVYRSAGDIFGAAIRREFAKDIEPLTLFEQFVLGFMKEYGAQKVQQVSSTTRRQVEASVSQGIAEGLGNDVIARRVRQDAPAIARLRSAVIARTETHTASQFGQVAMAKSLQIPLKKAWITVEDDRTRDTHSAVDGQSVGLHDSFVVGGALLDYPGDPSGPPEEIINCRCATIFEPG